MVEELKKLQRCPPIIVVDYLAYFISNDVFFSGNPVHVEVDVVRPAGIKYLDCDLLQVRLLAADGGNSLIVRLPTNAAS